MGKSELSKMLISKKNEVYLRLTDVEPSIAAELNDFFTFEVPGFKYMPAYRSKMWDGKIRLFDVRKRQLYYGLYEYVKKFCETGDYELQIDEGVTVGDHNFSDIVSKLVSTRKFDEVELNSIDNNLYLNNVFSNNSDGSYVFAV